MDQSTPEADLPYNFGIDLWQEHKIRAYLYAIEGPPLSKLAFQLELIRNTSRAAARCQTLHPSVHIGLSPAVSAPPSRDLRMTPSAARN